MNAIVERGMVNPTSLAVLRGKDAVSEMCDLLIALRAINADIEEVDGLDDPQDCPCFVGVAITQAEFLDVLNRRREAVTKKIENRGLRIAPDPTPAFSEELA